MANKDDGLPETAVEEKAAAPVLRSFASVFMHADAMDVALMVLGLVGAMGDGMSTPVMLAITSRVFDDTGSGPDHLQQFSSNVNVRNTLFLAAAHWIPAFLEAFCWTRTAERQSSRMRSRYLRAVLRQDVAYFDLNAGSASSSEVVAGVSGDTLAVQDALSEKVPNFLMNATLFVSSYAVAFALLWRLTLVSLPSALLLVVPGFLYGRVQIGWRAVSGSSARARAPSPSRPSPRCAPYTRSWRRGTPRRGSPRRWRSRCGSGSGRGSPRASPSAAAASASPSSPSTSGTAAASSCTTDARAAASTSSPSSLSSEACTALGSALSNVKYLAEASTAAERIMEVIGRVPKIDSESGAGEEPESFTGEVEFRSVDFCYPSRPKSPVLVGFSLRVPAGRTVALVGPSGSGKSTGDGAAGAVLRPVGRAGAKLEPEQEGALL